ncbi:MAG: hypothetical protein ABIY70_08705 [Capsulimonas sp.]|uniref:hypothetical protein n=1 Tax=Capsulimonas sp. TaxID=2494211 RepID=UPI003262DE19
MNTDDQPEQGRKNRRTEIPNIVYEMRLDPFAFALYSHVVKTAGEDGVCYKSTETLAEEAVMSAGKVSASKKILFAPREELGGKSLLVCEKKAGRHGGSPKHHMRVVDVWPDNKIFWDEIAERRTAGAKVSGSQCEPGNEDDEHLNAQTPAPPSQDERESVPRSQYEPAGSPHERAGSYCERAGSPHERIKTPGIKTPGIKEDSERASSGEAPRGAGARVSSQGGAGGAEPDDDDPVVQAWPHLRSSRGGPQQGPPVPAIPPGEPGYSPPAPLTRREEFKARYPLTTSPQAVDAAWAEASPTEADWDKIEAALAPLAARPVQARERSTLTTPQKWLRERRWEWTAPFQSLEIYRRDHDPKAGRDRDPKARDGPGRGAYNQPRGVGWGKKGGADGAGKQGEADSSGAWKSAHKQAHEI